MFKRRSISKQETAAATKTGNAAVLADFCQISGIRIPRMSPTFGNLPLPVLSRSDRIAIPHAFQQLQTPDCRR
jgi:hypothetical protein